jgi:hypothetical protein
VNFPRDIPIRVTLLADCPRSLDGTVRALWKFRDSVGGRNGGEKSRIAFGHRAPKYRSAIRRADSLLGRPEWVGRPTNFRPKFSGRPTKSTGSDRNGRKFRVTFWAAIFPAHQSAEWVDPASENFGDGARGRNRIGGRTGLGRPADGGVERGENCSRCADSICEFRSTRVVG